MNPFYVDESVQPTRRPLLLDLFCGAGGAAVGYHRAGFDVVGVDNRPQPRYPFSFVEGDALEFLASPWVDLSRFAAIHASPPCQDHSPAMTAAKRGTAWMLTATIRRLQDLGRPFVVENVPGARRVMPSAYPICGKALGLAPLKRHRLFLTNFPMLVPECTCRPLRDQVVSVYGELRISDRRTRADRPSMRAGVDKARELLGCHWMTGDELSQAIPPAYTEFIGEQLLSSLAAAA